MTRPLGKVFGKRVIVVGGGAQVAQVALGAVTEADRHNLRGERISVDTIPLVGEDNIAFAVRAVADLPRARMLVLAGSIMGGEISRAAEELRAVGIPIIALNMVGSITEHVDLVVSRPGPGRARWRSWPSRTPRPSISNGSAAGGTRCTAAGRPSPAADGDLLRQPEPAQRLEVRAHGEGLGLWWWTQRGHRIGEDALRLREIVE